MYLIRFFFSGSLFFYFKMCIPILKIIFLFSISSTGIENEKKKYALHLQNHSLNRVISAFPILNIFLAWYKFVPSYFLIFWKCSEQKNISVEIFFIIFKNFKIDISFWLKQLLIHNSKKMVSYSSTFTEFLANASSPIFSIKIDANCQKCYSTEKSLKNIINKNN
jgi:hypothetical protein